MRIALHVNVDHVATVRQARGTAYPDPVEAAIACERAGADGITVHLREDRRHIQDRDVRVLREVVQGTLNLEMAATAEMVAMARAIRPDHVTLVPERRQERTTEGGLDVIAGGEGLAHVVRGLQKAEIIVSLFIAPVASQIERAAALGIEQVELHTGEYADAARGHREHHVIALAMGAARASELGLRVAAGHGLNVRNVGEIAAIPQIVELNIGHAIVSDSLMVGVSRAVRSMRHAMNRARRAAS